MNIKYQKGATLVIVMVFLIILTVLGVASMSGSVIQQKSSTNIYMESAAFNAAESVPGAMIASHNSGGNFNLPTVKIVNPADAPYYCVGADGTVTEKGKAGCAGSMDGSGAIMAQGKAVYLDCPDLCSGFDIKSKIKCNYWKITGEATVGNEVSNSVEQVVSQVGACASSTIPKF